MTCAMLSLVVFMAVVMSAVDSFSFNRGAFITLSRAPLYIKNQMITSRLSSARMASTEGKHLAVHCLLVNFISRSLYSFPTVITCSDSVISILIFPILDQISSTHLSSAKSKNSLPRKVPQKKFLRKVFLV